MMSWRNFTLGDALDLERMLKLRQTKNVDQRGAMGCKDTSLKFLHLLTSPKDRKIGLCRSSMRHRRERKWGRRRFLSRNAAIKEKWSKRANECELIFGVSGGNLSTSHVAVVVVVVASGLASCNISRLWITCRNEQRAVHEVHQQQQRASERERERERER